jgi:hypothetical protein
MVMGWRPGLVLGCALLAGCNTTSVDIESEDRNSFFPALRVSYPFFPNPQQESSSPAPRVSGRLALDADVSWGQGDASQALPVGENVNFDGVQFNGPTRVTQDYDLLVGTMNLRGGFGLRDLVFIEGLVGVGATRLDLTLESPLQRESDRSVSLGPGAGLRGTVAPLSWLEAYVQIHGLIGFGEGEVRTLETVEAALRIAPTSYIAIFAGWRWWDYEQERSGESDLELKLSGPLLGLQFTF